MSGQQRSTRNARAQPGAKPDALTSDAGPGRTSPSSAATASELLHTLARAGEVVAAIGAALALAPGRLARAEAPDRLELDTDLPLSAFDAWDAPTVAGWFLALGPDLRIDVALSGGSQSQPSGVSASLRAGRDSAQALADFLDVAHQAERDSRDEVTVTLRLAIAKTRALEATAALLALRPEYLGTPEMLARTTIAVFYCARAFHRLIGMHALADWERLGLAREDGRAAVVLCDQPGYLAGVALEILGVRIDAALRWLAVSRAGFRQFRQRAEQTRLLRDEEGSWATAPRVLTPAHLRVVSRAPGLEDTAARLAHLQSGLAAAYLADSVHASAQSDLILRFAGPRPATCRIPAKTATALTRLGGKVDIPAESATASRVSASSLSTSASSSAPSALELESQIPANTATPPTSPLTSVSFVSSVLDPRPLVRLCAWAYDNDNASPDKLAIARECLARELPHGEDVSLAGVESAAAGALEAAKANLTLYLRRNTEQYFSIRQKALDAVTTYTAAVRKSVSDLTGEVVDNVYRTAGLLVGVVIAGLIQPSFSLGVARLAALVYTAYIAFLVAFFMRARWRRFELERAGLEQHLAALPELGPSERDSLRRQPADAEAYFTSYFRRAWWIYVGLGAASLLIFLLLWTPLASLMGLPHSR